MVFTKAIDRISLATDEDEVNEVTDRAYWEKKSTPKILKQVDTVFEAIKEYAPGYELKYNKFYIGLAINGVARNFVSFRPKKNYMYLAMKSPADDTAETKLEEAGLETTYNARWRERNIRLNSSHDYMKNKELLDTLIKGSMQYLNILDE